MRNLAFGIVLDVGLIHSDRTISLVKASPPGKTQANSTKTESQERLAKALRENLARRKAQQRARDSKDTKAGEAPTAKGKRIP